jgi:hypothetical protein
MRFVGFSFNYLFFKKVSPSLNSQKGLRKKAAFLFAIGLIGTCFLYYASEQFSVRRKPLEQVRIMILFISKIVSNIKSF